MMAEKYAYLCCGYKSFTDKPEENYDICEVCFLENAPIQLDNPNYEDGANKVSLKEGQKYFLKFGACEKEMVKNVRIPNPDEERDKNWKPYE
ncbi:MAG: CPCC family cysteine-rich protein [Flavobacterium sp.]